MDTLQFPYWRPASASLPRMSADEIAQVFGPVAITRSGSDADSISTSPIVAQRLEPEVFPVFVREFPFYDLIEKVPANGIAHTFLQQVEYTNSTDPNTIGETGTVNDDANQYSRKTTNIALFAERRGVSLKAKYAGLQAGGPSTDLMAREIQGGLLTLARDAQMECLRYQESDSASTTATAVNGKYDVNGFNGLRYVLQNQSAPENTQTVDVTSSWTDQRVLNAIREVAQVIMDKGGRPDMIVTSALGSNNLFKDQQELIRYMDNRLELTPGRSVRVVSTDAGELPVLILPGTPGVGTYVSNGHTYQDIFILQMETLELPYLGAPEPTILRIPLGTDGTVRELAIPFVMLGLACKAPQYLGRVAMKIV